MLKDTHANVVVNLDTNEFLVFDKSGSVKNDYYLNSDLYVQPSWDEVFGIPAFVLRYTAQLEVVGYTCIIVHKLSGQVIYENLPDFTNLDLETRKKNIDNISKKISKNFFY